MLIVRVFVDSGLVPPFDPRPIRRIGNLHRNKKYLGFVFDHWREIDTPEPGEVAVFRFGRC